MGLLLAPAQRQFLFEQRQNNIDCSLDIFFLCSKCSLWIIGNSGMILSLGLSGVESLPSVTSFRFHANKATSSWAYFEIFILKFYLSIPWCPIRPHQIVRQTVLSFDLIVATKMLSSTIQSGQILQGFSSSPFPIAAYAQSCRRTQSHKADCIKRSRQRIASFWRISRWCAGNNMGILNGFKMGKGGAGIFSLHNIFLIQIFPHKIVSSYIVFWTFANVRQCSK